MFCQTGGMQWRRDRQVNVPSDRGRGLRLAVSWLTVWPVSGPVEVGKGLAGRAIGWAPVVGAVLGAGAAALMWVLQAAGASAGVSGLVVVGALVMGTRGMHVDGLADTLDGLGCYGSAERAREVMKSGGIGAFGVAGVVLALVGQAVAFAALAQEHRWAGIAVAVFVGRVAVVLACRMPVAAAPGTQFGALVAGTQSSVVAGGWMVVALAASVLVGYWLGPVAVLVGLAASVVLVWHCARRFEGLSGDVLGAVIEVTVTAVAVIASLDTARLS